MPRRARVRRGGCCGSRASRSRCRDRGSAGSSGTPTATCVRACRGAASRSSGNRSRAGAAGAPRRRRERAAAASPSRLQSTRASARAPTTDARSERAARRDGPSPPASSAAPAARPCGGTARSRSHLRPAGPAASSPRPPSPSAGPLEELDRVAVGIDDLDGGSPLVTQRLADLHALLAQERRCGIGILDLERDAHSPGREVADAFVSRVEREARPAREGRLRPVLVALQRDPEQVAVEGQRPLHVPHVEVDDADPRDADCSRHTGPEHTFFPMSDLFSDAARERTSTVAPLALRVRPASLEDFVGQRHVLGEGSALRLAIQQDRVGSLILYGPPGSGKTTLARIVAGMTGAAFEELSAVSATVANVREVLARARERLGAHGQRTILFLDEIHRFNKAQQDALLPAVEDGTITLIGATTENPYFEVISALLSRSRVLVLNPLSEEEVQTIVRRALADEERGLAGLHPDISDRLIARLAKNSSGDARMALAALEAAVEATSPDSNNARVINEETLIEALGRAQFAYDKGGEEHYNLASALIKSLRNSDVNAALYWLARMIEGGADPIFIARRLCILASEDIGLADPNAMVQAAAAAEITRLIGLPEALFPLTQATIYLARAPKSNAVLRAYSAAQSDAVETSREPVPLHLRNAPTPLMKHLGYGKEYRYVHEDATAKEEMSCLPEKLKGKVYYEDEESGDRSQEPE